MQYYCISKKAGRQRPAFLGMNYLAEEMRFIQV